MSPAGQLSSRHARAHGTGRANPKHGSQAPAPFSIRHQSGVPFSGDVPPPSDSSSSRTRQLPENRSSRQGFLRSQDSDFFVRQVSRRGLSECRCTTRSRRPNLQSAMSANDSLSAIQSRTFHTTANRMDALFASVDANGECLEEECPVDCSAVSQFSGHGA